MDGYNADLVAVLEGSEKIKVEKIGPIAFRKNWQRFPNTVEFSENKDRVCYEFGIEFEFDASRSQKGLTPDSVLQVRYNAIILEIEIEIFLTLTPFLIIAQTKMDAFRIRC